MSPSGEGVSRYEGSADFSSIGQPVAMPRPWSVGLEKPAPKKGPWSGPQSVNECTVQTRLAYEYQIVRKTRYRGSMLPLRSTLNFNSPAEMRFFLGVLRNCVAGWSSPLRSKPNHDRLPGRRFRSFEVPTESWRLCFISSPPPTHPPPSHTPHLAFWEAPLFRRSTCVIQREARIRIGDPRLCDFVMEDDDHHSSESSQTTTNPPSRAYHRHLCVSYDGHQGRETTKSDKK